MKRRSVLLSGVALSGTALANDSIFFSPLKYLGAEQQRSIDASRSLLDNLIPPSLPQYDNLAGKLARRAVLTSKKLVYVWTENFANVKGVPMARSVPLGELPNVDWLLKTAGVIVELIVNFVASLPASAAAQFERIATGLSGDLEAARQVHEALLEEAKNDPAAAGSLLLRFTELQTRVIALLTRVGLLVDDILKSASNLVTQGGQGDGLNRFRAVFGTLRLPEVADSFRDDEAFAYWRVAGPNPLLIRRVDAPGDGRRRQLAGGRRQPPPVSAGLRRAGQAGAVGSGGQTAHRDGLRLCANRPVRPWQGSGEAIAGGHPVRTGPRYPSDVRASRRVGE